MNISSHLDPINALATHFRSSDFGSINKHGVLKVPSFLHKVFSKKFSSLEGAAEKTRTPFAVGGVKELVSSISNEEFERWCMLDETAFTHVTKILLEAAPCLSKDQGLFRMIEALETLRDENSELAMSNELLSNYKDTVGESLVVELLTYFIEAKESEFSRRWAGLLLVELLEDSQKNKECAWGMPNTTFKNIGEIIISGADRMLKIVAGKIIWQMMQDFKDEDVLHRLPAFCPSGGADDFIKDFPLQNGSQWESEFAAFVANIEEKRYDLDIGLPTGYSGYQVRIGNNNPINSEFGVISISIAEIFSIYIPPNRNRSPDWVDFKIVNISKIESTSQGVKSHAMGDFTYFKLHLCDYEKDGYLYLMSMRPSSDSDNVMILCYKADADDFAKDVERCKTKVLRQKSNRLPISSAPVNDIQANPAYHQSQQVKLDELERHRDDILKILKSSEEALTSPVSFTNANEGDCNPNLLANKRGELRELEEKGTQSKKTVVEVDIPGLDSPDQGSKISSISGEQTLVSHSIVDKHAQGLAEISGGAPRKIAEEPTSSLSIQNVAKDSNDNTFGMVLRNTSRNLRPLRQKQQVSDDPNRSDLDLTDITDGLDEPQMELLFEDALARRATKRSAKSAYNTQKKHEATNSGVVGRLELPVKGNTLALELEDEERKISQLPIPLKLPLHSTSATGNNPELGNILKEGPQLAAPDIARALRKSPRLAEIKQPLGKKLKPATRNPLKPLDDSLEIKKPVRVRNTSKKGNKFTVLNAGDSLGVSTMKKTMQSRDKAKAQSRLMVLERPKLPNILATETHIKREDMLEGTPSDSNSHIIPAAEAYIMQKDGPGTKPRPAVANPTWLLDDITPPGTYEARQMIEQKGKLKDRLTGKNSRSNKKANSAIAISNPAPKSHTIIRDLERPKLVSPEDTSIWDLPDSEGSVKAGNLRSGRGKGNSKTGPKKPTPVIKHGTKQNLGPEKRAYGKKSALDLEQKSNERIFDSSEEIGSGKEGSPDHAPIHKPKPKLNIIPKSTRAKRAVFKGKKDKEMILDNDSKPFAHALRHKATLKVASASLPAKSTSTRDRDEEVDLAAENINTIPTCSINQNSKPRAAFVPAKRAVANSNRDKEINVEGQKLPTGSPKLKPAHKAACASIPTKRMVDWNNLSDEDENEGAGPLIKKQKTIKTTKAKTLSRPSRVTVKRVPGQFQFDVFQNTSEADGNSSWRPKTRLQAKMELAAKSLNQVKVTGVVTTKATCIKGSETSQKTESSEESLENSSSMSSPAPRLQKTRGLSDDPITLTSRINRPETMKQDLSLSLKPRTETPTEFKDKGSQTKRIEYLGENKFPSPEKQILQTPTQLSARNCDERTESDHDNIVVAGSDDPGSDNYSEVTDVTDLIGSTRLNQIPKPRPTERRVISEDRTRMLPNPLSNASSIAESTADQSRDKFQLRDIAEMSDKPDKDWSMKERSTKKQQKQNLPFAMGQLEPIENQAPTAVMEVSGPQIIDANCGYLPKNSLQDLISPKKNNPKLVVPSVTQGRLDEAPKIPRVDPDALIDDHLARKAQIISWNSEGPKNQGRTPVAEKNPVDCWLGHDEYSTDDHDEAQMHDPVRALSLYVLASEDEDRIVKKGQEPIQRAVYPTMRSTGNTVDENGSLFSAATIRERIASVEPFEIDNLKGRNCEKKIGLLECDTLLDVAGPKQEFLEREPLVIKMPRESKCTVHTNFWNIDDDYVNSSTRDASSDNDEVICDSDSLEEITVPIVFRKPVVAKEEISNVQQEDLIDRKVDIIEIIESDLEEKSQGLEFFPKVNQNLTSFSSRNKLLLAEKIQSTIKSLPPAFKEGVSAPHNHLVTVRTESTGFGSLYLASREISSALDGGHPAGKASLQRNTLSRSGTTGSETNQILVLAKDETHRQTTFIKWLQGINSKASNNDGYNNRSKFQNLRRNLQFDDPDKTLVNEGDFGDTEMGRDPAEDSEGDPGQEWGLGRDVPETDSEDSSNFSTDEDSDEDEDGEGEELSEEENSQTVWRQSIPDHHGETLAVLDQISQRLLRYLMSSEELAMEVIEDFEKQANEIVKKLGESHKREYEDFLVKVELGKKKVRKEHTVIMESIENNIAELRGEKAMLEDLRAKMNDDYRTLDSTISMLIVRLEEELKEDDQDLTRLRVELCASKH